MDKLWQEAVSQNDFAAEATSVERQMQVAFTGTADLTVKFQLDRFLRTLHAEAQRRSIEAVSVDVRGLEFMNSSCLKSFVWWISALQEQPAEHRYRIMFVASPTVYWQRRSLCALACLANDLISVQS